jgi:hypothetical protein
MARLDEGTKIRRFLEGQKLGGERRRRLVREEGPDPAQAVAESLSALNAAETMGLWPGPRDPLAERAVQEVRRRWARVQKRAQLGRQPTRQATKRARSSPR